MEYPVSFARHFARLGWLLLHEAGTIEEQKAALRAIVAVSRDGPVTLESRNRTLEANGAEVAGSATGAMELADRLASHGLCAVSFDAGAAAADLLGLARILAAVPPAEDASAAAESRLQALGARTVHLTAGTAAPPVDVASTPQTSGILTGEASLLMTFAATQAPSGTAEELLARLGQVSGVDAATSVLDDLVMVAEEASRDGKPMTVADVFVGIVRREEGVTQPDVRRAYVLTLRRMARPVLLRNVATLLPRKRERLADYELVLARTGEDGADAVIEQLTQAQATDDRRVYFDVLLRLQAGVPALVHMLGDARWFVARNAADLLGEMKALEAEPALIELLRHADDRVRRAATAALMALETKGALKAVHAAVHDDAPQVRAQAVAAIAQRRSPVTAGTLVSALDDEENADVQYAILSALGKVATRDAVERLIEAAEPDGRFFRRKPTEFRVAAVQALGEARTPAALDALRGLEKDREREVRDAAARLLARTTPR